ncbi:DUF2971 domain-containing protein [Aeromonas caviae]
MAVFYKYTGNLGANFFKKPTAKISIPYYLNDPFESETGDNLVTVIESAIVQNNKFLSRDKIKIALNGLINSNGIFSVSETPRNPLMWSHYAEQHNGFCIGFNEDLFSGMRKSTSNSSGFLEYKPTKVFYDSYRFDRQTSVRGTKESNNALKRHLLTKSDEWIYEKEHRCILPFIGADRIYINKKNKLVYSYLAPKTHIDSIIKVFVNEGKIIEKGRGEYEFAQGVITESDVELFSSFGCVSFLYDINPKHIDSIYIGLRVDNKTTKAIYRLINSEKMSLSHIKLFKFRLSTKRFELLPDVVDKEYISNLQK